MNEPKSNVNGMLIFGYPIRDWIFLLSLLGFTGFGGAILGGTPNETTTTISEQTTEISDKLREIQRALDESSQIALRERQRNTRRFNDIYARQDSLHKTTLDGLRNLDGYFRGRLDELRGDDREPNTNNQRP